MSPNKITVITPTYNRAHTLKRAYESLKRQSFKDFKWLIADDGSTDDTEKLVDDFVSEGILKIEYKKYENSKKFYTVFKAIETVKTDYFTILDSDDAYTPHALGTLVNEANKLNPTEFISVIGHSEDENGNLYGTAFPNAGFDGSILEMRYKLKVKGDKNGLFITEPYLKYLNNFDYEIYKGKYAPQKIFFNIYDAEKMKTRFINKVIRIYHYDVTDTGSMSNERVRSTSYMGLMEGHLSFLNSYKSQLFLYPEALFRNLIGYQVYAIKLGENYFKIISDVKQPLIKFLGFLSFPFSYFYSLMKK